MVNNPLDKANFVPSGSVNSGINNLQQAYLQARQNPKNFEEQMRQNNPQAYQYACQLRENMTPQNAVMQLAQQRGLNPDIFKMLGLN